MLRYKQVIENKKYNGFIPYAYHYNHESIITKNGELIMVIKIISPKNEASLKTQIQDFFNKNIIKDVSFWITSIRSKHSTFFSDSSDKNELKNFSQKLYDSYISFSKIENYENECYISLIIHDHINLLNIKNIFQIITNFDKRFYKESLNRVMIKLKRKCDLLMKELNDFKPELLSIKNENDEFYSEIELFFSKILCKKEKFIKLQKNDISSVLTKNQRMKFVDSDIVIKANNEEKEKYCAVFSFKDVPSLTNQKLIDSLLDMDCEIIATEILISGDKNDKRYIQKIKNLKKFKELIEVGEDEFLKEYSQSIKNNQNAFFKQNILMIISDQENLNFFCYIANKKFSDNGIILYRENVAAEEVFWSQMPGNFHYSTRLNPVSLDKICNINNVQTHENLFNDKLIFSDYFFSKKNFRIKEENLFLIVGDNESILYSIDFLITMTIGFDVQIFHFGSTSERKFSDYKASSKIIYINDISTKLQEDVKDGVYKTFSIFEILFEERCDRKIFNEIMEYFFHNKIEFNCQNFFMKIEEKKLFSEKILEKMNFIKKHNQQEKYHFVDMHDLSEEEIFIILNMYLLISMIEKICFKENILFFFKELKQFFLNDQYKDLLLIVLVLIRKYNIFLYAEIFDHQMLSMDFMKDVESTLMIFPSNVMRDLYETLNINNEGLKFLNSISNEDQIICFKSDNKFYFADFDVQKFFSEEKNSIFK